MEREHFDSEHETFRGEVRGFIKAEVLPMWSSGARP
jgi:hypothetical protein